MKKWLVIFCNEFESEFEKLSVIVQDELLARAKLLAKMGPGLGRPYVDTLNGSKYSNMK